MKNREELLTEIYDETPNSDQEETTYITVNCTVYAALEYLDDAIAQYGHYDVLNKVLKTIRTNVAQLGDNK
jgi:hypothetical protein